tara:strand:- start:1474 stop:1590 length:117 start_codon:yes stop_codon:yes gene_type:complete
MLEIGLAILLILFYPIGIIDIITLYLVYKIYKKIEEKA